MPRIVCIIPARWESSRFAGKPLADIAGKPMIQHVYERVLRSPSVQAAAVATDDERIQRAVARFGGRVLMTDGSHRTGTDRIARAVEELDLKDEDIVVNVQGDQPLFEPVQIDEVAAPLLSDPSLQVATLVYPIERNEEITHPNAVKTVFDRTMNALYFSRAAIPFNRKGNSEGTYYKHHGIYAFRRSFLRLFTTMETGDLESRESLEQLRILEYGHPIRIVVSAHDSIEVDNAEELERVRGVVLSQGGQGS